jgi:glyoxylase-like metal-dependent hydrolase (beta-lactamase superfamily II)
MAKNTDESRVEYEVFALRYGTNPRQLAAHNFIDGDPHGTVMPMDYFVWVVRDASRTFLIDTGFDAAAAAERGRDFLAPPSSLLAELGIKVAEVEDIVVTHLHYDHAGNRDMFPNARFHLQDREMAYATGRCMCHPGLHAAFDSRDVAAMVSRVFEGRVHFHDGHAQLAEGLKLHRVGGHTDGLQIVRVWTRRGWLVLASDASHYYANMEQRRSFPIVYNVGDMYEGHRICAELASRPENIIPGHDPAVMQRFPGASRTLADRIVRLDGDMI